jgi:hypothetical protein
MALSVADWNRKKVDEGRRPGGPMRIGAAKEPIETMASWEFDIAAEGAQKRCAIFWPKANHSDYGKRPQ